MARSSSVCPKLWAQGRIERDQRIHLGHTGALSGTADLAVHLEHVLAEGTDELRRGEPEAAELERQRLREAKASEVLPNLMGGRDGPGGDP